MLRARMLVEPIRIWVNILLASMVWYYTSDGEIMKPSGRNKSDLTSRPDNLGTHQPDGHIFLTYLHFFPFCSQISNKILYLTYIFNRPPSSIVDLIKTISSNLTSERWGNFTRNSFQERFVYPWGTQNWNVEY